MKKTPWFERKFPIIEDNGLMPSIIERLAGTPARLREQLAQLNVNLGASVEGKWSIKKEIGHLIDLEPLWFGRMEQIVRGEKQLMVADLTNRKTHETDHDSVDAADLVAQFAAVRAQTVALLRRADDAALENAATHPRLGTPMRLVDLAYFVAEHDDHHLAQITVLSGGA